MSQFTEERVKYITENFQKFKSIQEFSEEYAKHWNIPFTDNIRRSISRKLSEKGIRAYKKPSKEEDTFKKAQTRKLSHSKYFIITAEQNETPIHTEFWKNILAYKEFLGAELSVILMRYKNPNSVFSDKIHENWSPLTAPYHDAARHDIHKYLTILGDIKIQPTASQPLSGLEDISGTKSAIVGHPKLHLQALPVLEGHPKKIMLTTGCISLPNYTDSYAGKKGENAHRFGFVIVEVRDEEVFFIRQCEATEDGSFIDLINEVKNGEVSTIDYYEALVMGDVHVGSIDPEVDEETQRFLEAIPPKHVILHDLLDGASCNHHILKNPIEMYRRQVENKHIIEREIQGMIRWVYRKLEFNPVVVSSNHNFWLDQYISQDWRKDLPNASTYMKYADVLLNGKAPKGLIAYILEEEFDDYIITLGDNDSFILANHELAVHGHLGSNGSRGTFEQYRKLNYPVITGHSHTPMRRDNAISVGTSTYLRASYNKGASSWLHAHVMLHSNGKCQHLLFIENSFTTFNF